MRISDWSSDVCSSDLHGVTRVPALAMIPGDPVLPYCEREDESPRAAHVAYGDAALSGLLEEIARLGGKEEVRDAQSRSEEHTSELQSLMRISYAVFCLKKKKYTTTKPENTQSTLTNIHNTTA